MSRLPLILAGGLGAAAVGALIFALPTPEPAPVVQTNAVLIEDVRYFDGTGLTPPQTLLLSGGLIRAVDPGQEIIAARTVDGTGLVALPGLIDAHTHTYGDALTNSLRFGVTANLDMFTAPQTLTFTRPAREALAPTDVADLFSAGMLATAPGGHGTQFGVPVQTLTGPDQARGWVSARIAEGSDYIKLVYMPYQQVFESLDLATAQAVIDAAHAEGVMAVAHVSTLQAAREMVEAGVDGLVHVFADAPVDDAFLEAALASDVFVIPTLSVLASISRDGSGQRLAEHPDVAPYIDAAQRQSLAGGFGLPPLPDYDLTQGLENVRRLHAAGVTILAGSDAPNPGTTHGASLHDEMRLLTQAGLSPTEALAAATVWPATRFGLTGRGRITQGARADLVLVAGDPTTDIRETLEIVEIFKNGVSVARIPGSAAPSETFQPGPISAFDSTLEGPNGFVWSATDDQMFGGASTAAVTRRDGVLEVSAEVAPGFFVPWAGAAFVSARSQSATDLSAVRHLHFNVRGAPGEYRALFFMAGDTGAPPMLTFEVTEDWAEIALDLDTAERFDPTRFAGLALVAGPGQGEFRFELENVRFE